MTHTYRERLLNSFDRRFLKMRDTYRQALGKVDHGSVHDCRVAIKRLRALFRMVGEISPRFDDRKRFRGFRRLFKAFADIRDLHIQIGLAEELAGISGFSVDAYLQRLRSRERKAWKRFRVFSDDFNVDRLHRRASTIARALEDISPEVAGERARARLAGLHDDLRVRMFGAEPEEDTMHAIRILSKELYYTREVVDEVFPDDSAEDPFLNRLRGVHQALGKWHDYEVALEFLNHFLRKYETSSEVVAEARSRFEERKREHREAFIAAWKEFVSA